MNLHNSILFKKVGLFLLLFSFTPPTTSLFAADDMQLPDGMQEHAYPPEIQQQIKKMQTDFLEQMLQSVLKSFDQIEFDIETLAQIVNNDQLRKINPKMIRKHLINLRMTIAEIKKGAYIVVDPYSIKVLLAVCQAFIDHLRALVKNGMKTIPELDLESTIKRSLSSDEIDFKQMEKEVISTQKCLEKLDQESQTVGLSFFNRLYRRIEKLSSDHHVVKRTGLLLFGSLVTYFLVGSLPLMENKIVENKTYNPYDPEGWDKLTYFEKLRVFLTRPRYDKFDNLDPIQKQYLGKMGIFEDYAKNIGLASLALTPLITWEVIASPFKNDWKSFKHWAQKKWESIRSFLRGGPLQNKVESWKKDPKATFDDVIGKEHIKRAFQLIINYISDPERFDRAGMPPDPGHLLYGPPGSGKTYLVEALAGEIKKVFVAKGLGDKFNFLSFNAADVTQFGLETIIMLAKENAPCVVFIDEIHLCGWQNERDGKGLAEALTALSGCMNISQDTSKTVIIIGATNHPENLDKALKRRGRFGEHLYSGYPDYVDRLGFLKRELGNRSIITIDEEYLAKLAHETENCTFEDLKAILIGAMQKAKGQGKVLTQQYLEEAFDEKIRRIVGDELKLPGEQKRILAVHQAGHSLASLLYSDVPQITKVTIRPINIEIKEENIMAKYTPGGKERTKPKHLVEYGKVFTLNPLDTNTIKSHQRLLNELKVLLAGHVAEKIVLGSSGYSYHKDEKSVALDLAKFIVFEGMYEEDLPKAQRTEYNQKAFELMVHCEQEVKQLLELHKDKLVAIADALQEKLTLSSVELLEVLKKCDSPEDEAANSTTPIAA